MRRDVSTRGTVLAPQKKICRQTYRGTPDCALEVSEGNVTAAVNPLTVGVVPPGKKFSVLAISRVLIGRSVL
jgi:hypothetical protein